MQFKQVEGNIETKTYLTEVAKNNRIAHAYLFSGGKNSAKLPIAFAFSQYINCHNQKEKDSCGECPSCLKYQTINHPDLHLIFPVLSIRKVKKPVSDHFVSEWKKEVQTNPYISLENWFDSFSEENKTGKTGYIYTHEAEVLKQKMSLKNYESKYKVVIIWMPEKMQLSTANKLLKLLEEPPDKTVFILVSETPNLLLKTIVSRLQIIEIKEHTHLEIEKILEEKHMSSNITRSLQKTNYDISKATKYLNNKNHEENYFEEFQKWMRICYAVDIKEAINWTNTTSKRGRSYQIRFLTYSLKMIRYSFLINFIKESKKSINEEEHKFLLKFHEFIHERNVVTAAKKIEECIKNIERNGNIKLMIYELSLQFMRLLKVNRRFVDIKN